MATDVGKVVEVSIVTAGTEAIRDHAVGERVLQVEDISDFDDDGGNLSIDGVVYGYIGIDDELDTITLSTNLQRAVPDETPVLLEPHSEEKWATVIVEDGEDAVIARIPMYLQRQVVDGVRSSEEQETAVVELEGSEWVVRDLIGLEDSSVTKFWDDTVSVTVTGDQTIKLTHEPIPRSEHLYWNGLYQPYTEWSRDGRDVTVFDPTGALAENDTLTFEYAYQFATKPLAEWIIPVPGALTVNDAHTGSGNPPMVVGTNMGVWLDESDATYAQLSTWGTGKTSSVSYADHARGTLAAVPIPTDVENVAFYARVRYQTLAANMKQPRAMLYPTGSTSQIHASYTLKTPSPGGMVDVDLPLTINTTYGSVAGILNRIRAGTLDLWVGSGFLNYDGPRHVDTAIYEACLVVKEVG